MCLNVVGVFVRLNGIILNCYKFLFRIDKVVLYWFFLVIGICQYFDFKLRVLNYCNLFKVFKVLFILGNV